MPGSGKSTAGMILAKQCGRGFVDTDLLIQTRTGRSLQQIVDNEGYLALRKVEEDILLQLSVRMQVIATGGSAVYSPAAMAHLKSNGILVFLDTDLKTLQSRVMDFGTRGLAIRPGQFFEELYEERRPLYRTYAEVTIDCSGLSQEEVSALIIKELRRMNLSSPAACDCLDGDRRK